MGAAIPELQNKRRFLFELPHVIKMRGYDFEGPKNQRRLRDHCLDRSQNPLAAHQAALAGSLRPACCLGRALADEACQHRIDARYLPELFQLVQISGNRTLHTYTHTYTLKNMESAGTFN